MLPLSEFIKQTRLPFVKTISKAKAVVAVSPVKESKSKAIPMQAPAKTAKKPQVLEKVVAKPNKPISPAVAMKGSIVKAVNGLQSIKSMYDQL
jgi:hypothetical protein